MQIRAAAMSIADRQLVVVYCGLDLIENRGEAELTVDTLGTRFGNVPVVLLARDDEDTAHYYGDEEVVRSLKGIDVDEMPWKDYEV